MRYSRLLLIASVAALAVPLGGAYAVAAPAETRADRPLIGPAPNWALPAAIPAVPAAGEGGSTIDLLSDQQKKFTDHGDFSYVHVAYKIATPEGLSEAPLQISWDPALETLTIHKYQIIRDGKVVDLLGDGSKIAVIQRETNMESAALDGRLTATMQPTDVRVGDIIEIAFTQTRNDPALGGRSQALAGPADGRAFGRVRVRMVWPDDKKIQWKVFPGVLKPVLTHTSAGSELVADVTDVTTAIAPKGAPARYSVVNAIDVSEFPDWGAVSAAMLPLYTKAATLAPDSPVRAQAKRIAAATSDPVHRAELALQLVQDQIRYLYIGMDGGGYVPAAADLTWSRKFGDCKGKTVLLVALLKELGIDAEPVLVSTDGGDLVGHRLPAMSAFDHVLVRARIGGRTYWLDGTGLGDTKLDRLDTPPYEFGLPISAGTKDLIPLVPEQLTAPAEVVTLDLDASAGIDAPAPAKGEMRFSRSNAAQMRAKFSGLSVTDREQELRKLWRDSYDFVSPTTVSAGMDERSGDYVITMTGTAKMDWYSDVGTRWYELDRARLGWKLDIDRDGAIETDAPFAIDYPDYWASRETIKLPTGVTGFRLQGGGVDQQIGGIYSFHRKVAIADGVVTMESSTQALAPELPASKAEQTRSEMSALANGGVYVRVPDDYMATAADIAALQSNKPALARVLAQRGAIHFDRGEYAQSLADEDAAIAADSSNADAHAVRALTLAFQKDPKTDEAADRAIALDPKQSLAWRAKGVIAVDQKRYDDADADFSKQLALNPRDAQAFAARASVRIMREKFQDALADVDSALSLAPDVNIRILRAAALAGLERKDDALAEADRAVAAAPDNEDVLKARAELRKAFGEATLAIADYDALLRQKPKVEYYLDRAVLWPASEKAKREADIQAALKLDPKSAEALRFSAALGIEESDFARAEKAIAALERTAPEDRSTHILRLQLLEKQNRGRDALQVANSFIASHPGDAGALNERCWLKATMNIEIDTALADCDASLKLAPNSPATLDSRAFTHLRLGALDAAISDYDAALKLAPDLPASLFGRAVARARKGDATGARADLAQARKLNADIERRFAGFGVTLPPSLAEPAQAADQADPNRSR